MQRSGKIHPLMGTRSQFILRLRHSMLRLRDQFEFKATPMSLRGSRGADMKTTRINATSLGPHVNHVAAAHKPIEIAGNRRARLLGASALAGGALRGLVVAAGMATVFGGAPALAQVGCQSAATDLSAGAGGCLAAAATGVASTAVGRSANATGDSATAIGFSATATGFSATATGQQSKAIG
jgi:YadA head domain repeat (2 copies)